MIIRRKTREISRQYVEKKLIFKLRRLAIVLLAISGIIIYDILQGYIAYYLVLAGLLSGFLIGVFVGNYAQIRWNEETNKVIAKLNTISIIILIIYLIFTFSKKWIFGHWIHGPALSAFSFSIAAGVMTGRILSMRKQIRSILREKGFLKNKFKD